MWCDDGGRVFYGAGQTDLKEVANALLKKGGGSRVWLFFGEMGSGKTTLIKALCAELGVTDAMISPTFSIVN